MRAYVLVNARPGRSLELAQGSPRCAGGAASAIRSLRFANGKMTQAELVIAIEQSRDGLEDRPSVRRSARRRIPVPGLPRGDDMKAIVQDVYGSADVLELRDIDRPSIADA